MGSQEPTDKEDMENSISREHSGRKERHWGLKKKNRRNRERTRRPRNHEP
jgi:hypothetical protein